MSFPYFVKWAITDKCNLRCKHCYRNLKSIENESFKEIDLIISELKCKKVALVSLTGGEPLMSTNCKYIINSLNKAGIKTEIATNGTLINKEWISFFRKNNVKKIQISLEGYNAESNDYIRGAGTFEKICNAVALCNQNDIETIIAVTLKHDNVHDILSFIELKNKLNYTYLRFELFIPINADSYNLSLSNDDLNYLKEVFKNLKKYSFVIYPDFHNAKNCGAGNYSVFINSDFTLTPCDLLCDINKTKNKVSENYSISYLWNEDPLFVEWRKCDYSGCKLFKGGEHLIC